MKVFCSLVLFVSLATNAFCGEVTIYSFKKIVVSEVIIKDLRVRNPEYIAPCSVPTEITVCDPFTCCELKLLVCMPSSQCCTQPVVKHSGKLVRYSFGKYGVDIHFTKNTIIVDYDK